MKIEPQREVPKRREKETPVLKVVHRLRVGMDDVHYRNELAAGAHVLELFGDAGSEVLIKLDGDAGLLRAYESVEFLAPVYAADFLEVVAELMAVGRTSRKIRYEAYKVIECKGVGPFPSSGRVLDPPVLVARATGTSVVPLDRQTRALTEDG